MLYGHGDACIRYEKVPQSGKYTLYSVLEFGNKIKVTDPCYSIDTWCSYDLENVKSGNYNGYLQIKNEGVWGNRVTEIAIIHANHMFEISETDFKHVKEADIGVDSGQAGFFDYDMYANLPDDRDNDGGFYNECCDITLEKWAGTLKDRKGFVSSSGYGDGSYRLFTVEKDGQVIAAKIVFIGEDDREEEDES